MLMRPSARCTSKRVLVPRLMAAARTPRPSIGSALAFALANSESKRPAAVDCA